SMDRDATQAGYDIELTRTIATAVSIPVIASGGCGAVEHFVQVFKQGCADAALAASIFHYRSNSIRDVKKALQENDIHVRY
ncbi:MAG: HisA/HisF-related TIM barrel protein, partial [candidate division KSB1 bacterium]|nr:HisA/HisF-related TIM barrel protein [candidate division KSB1 bacterium]